MTTYHAFFDADGRLSILTSKPGSGLGDGPMYAGVSPGDPAVPYTGYEIDLDEDRLRGDHNLAGYIEKLVRQDRDSLAPARLLSADGTPA